MKTKAMKQLHSGLYSRKQTEVSLIVLGNVFCVQGTKPQFLNQIHFRILRKQRPNGSRKMLIFTLFLMIFTGTGRNHSSTYLYTQNKFNWGVSDYTNYMSFYVGMAIIRTFITTPVYCYGLKLHDCMLAATGLIMSIGNVQL